MPPRLNIYPWADTKGLCKILRDPSIWSPIFPESDDRQAVKRAAKKTPTTQNLPQVKVFNSTDDKVFGTIVVELLASPTGRKELAKELGKGFREFRLNKFIARGLYYKHLEKYQDRIPSFDEICEQHNKEWHLVPAKFADWLARKDISPKDQQSLSLYACYFALRQPEQAEAIFGVLVNHDTAFLNWLSDEEVAPEAPPVPTLPSLPEPAKANAQVEPQGVTALATALEAVPDEKRLPPQMTAFPPDSAELVRLLTSCSNWDRELSIDQLHRAVDLLTGKAERHAERLRELDEIHRRVTSHLESIAQIPWLESTLSLERYLSLPQGVSVEGALERFAAVEQEATHLLQAYTQMEALVSRLGSEPPPPIAREVTSLVDIAAYLEECVVDLTERLQEISEWEENVAEFFDRFAAADQESGHRLIENTGPSRWVDIASFIMAPAPKTDAGKRYEKLVGRFDLVGLIVAYLWRLDEDKAIEIVGSAVGNKQAPLTREKQIETLAFLTFGQLQQLTDSYADTAPSVAEIIFTAAISSGRFETLEYLEPMLHPPSINTACADFYKTVINAWRRGLLVDPAGQLNPALPTRRTAPSEDLAEKQRQRLLDLIRQPPSMTYNYHRLRVIARSRFFAPLEEVIKTGDSETVWEKWISYGSLDEMVEECVSASGKGRDLDSSHWSQTRRYLEIFQTGLERWRRMSRESNIDDDTEISKALASLQRERRLNHNDQANSLLTTLESLFEAGHETSSPSLDFGERCTTNGMIELSMPSQNLIQPIMTQSWPIAIAKGIVPLSVFLTDQLRHALGLAQGSLKEALQELLKRNEFYAAQRAADGDTELQRCVKEELDKKKTAFLTDSDRAELLIEAQNVRVHDKDIDVCLVEIHKALDAPDFEEASQWLDELENCIHRLKIRRDPTRRALVDFLREAKTSFREDASLDELEHFANAVRSNHEYRRLHLLQLQDERLPGWLRDAWSAAAQRMDRPALWPTEEFSLKLTGAIDTFVKFITGRLRYKDIDPAVTPLVQRLGEWIPAQLHVGLETENNQANGNIWKTFLGLAEEIGSCPEWRTWQIIGASELQRHHVPEALEQPYPPKLDYQGSKKIEGSKLAFVDFVHEIRETLKEQIGNEPACDSVDHAQLRTAARRSDWIAVRTLAAALIRGTSSTTSQDSISDVEAIYAVALAYSSPPSDLESRGKVFQHACLAVLSAGNAQQYYLPLATLDDVVARAFILMCNVTALPDLHNLPLGEQLGQALAGIIEMSRADTVYQWLSELLWKASHVSNKDGVIGSAKLAAQLWECLKGAKSKDKSRRDLLHILYRARRTEALKYLASYTKPLDELIAACINAFELAESDLEVRPRALQVSAAVREQARGKANTKPWILLFHRLEPTRSEMSGPPVSCTLETQFVDEGREDIVTIEIRLVPSIFDPPESLQLELGGTPLPPQGQQSIQINLLAEEETLLKERVISIPVPLAASDSAGGLLQLPYRLTGATIQGNQIDIRGSWTLQRTGKVSAVIPDELIRSAWPGATGEPVNRSSIDRGFHGREREIREVEAHLQAPDRQRSVMIFGQRRIGKTSLLVEMANMLPPRQGAICGAFLDVAGLSIPEERGSIPKAFFDYVVSALDSNPRNARIRAALEDRTGTKVEIHRLAKNLNPGASLADALEGLVDRLSEHSKGTVSRIALFVDEFDRFVKPLLSERKTEVDRLMWSLRQIVQQSQRISLVLAGSGLQRLFVEHYDDALFGSIDEVELKPFSWEDDREAIESTFIPLKRDLRDRLCRGDSFYAITKQAYELCGGHPYYLAMLGYSAALFSRGHHLTPPLLNRIAELMIRGEIRSVGPKIDAKRFYAHIFETLHVVHLRTSAIAKILLAHVSQRTTADYPWLTIGDAIEAPEILQLTDEGERLDALNALEKERALEIDKTASRVRIRVPLMSTAVREDAIVIRQEALRELKSLGGGSGR